MRHSWCSFDSLMFFLASKGFIGSLGLSNPHKFCHTTKSKGILLFNSDKYYRNKFELLFITIIISKDFSLPSTNTRQPEGEDEKEKKPL